MKTNNKEQLYRGYSIDYWIGYYDKNEEDVHYNKSLSIVTECAKDWWREEDLPSHFEYWLIAHGDTLHIAYLLADELGQTVGSINKGIINAFLMQNL